jgi:hypothetical protein
MSPDAPEAEIFKEYARKHESQNGTAAIPAAATGTLIKTYLSSSTFSHFILAQDRYKATVSVTFLNHM